MSRGGGEDDHEGPGEHPEEEHGGAVGVRRDSPGNIKPCLVFCENALMCKVQRALVEFAENDNTFDLKELLDVILEDLELKSASSSCTRS